jgi:hypothetical protein
MKTSEEGAGTTIHCATSPDVLPDAGSFFDRCALGSVSTAGANDELADALWEQTEKEIAAVKARPAGVAAAASSSEEKKASE